MVAIAILFASETGRARDLAYRLGSWLLERGVSVYSGEPRILDWNESIEWLQKNDSIAILVVATCGDGEVPRNMRNFWLRLLNRNCVHLHGKYALYGLGDARYGTKFNAAARKLDARLKQLGATPLVDRVLGDACAPGAGILQELPAFYTGLACALGIEEKNLRTKKKTPRYHVTTTQNTIEEYQSFTRAALEWDRHDCTVIEVIVTANTRLTSLDWNQDVRHLTLQPVSSEMHFHYAAGDVAAIEHENPPETIAKFFELCASTKIDFFGLANIDRVHLHITPTDDNDRDLQILRAPRPSLPSKISLKALARHCLDLTSPPSQLTLAELAPYAEDKDEEQKLKELASIQGAALFDEYAVQERRSLLEIFDDFVSLKAIPFAILLELFDWLHPRSFSIASPPSWHDANTFIDLATAKSSRTIELCIAKVEFTTPLGRRRIGAASAFLCQVQPSTRLHLITYKGSFFQKSLPPKPPNLILFGPGTGVAPMRSILGRCAPHQGQKILFFGCRNPEHDLLYYHDDQPFELVIAASRQPGIQRTYVTHKLRQLAPRVLDLIFQHNAYLFVAGNIRMATDLRATFLDIIQIHLNFSAKEASATLSKLEREGRFAIEAYG